jgi:hypothetical protein
VLRRCADEREPESHVDSGIGRLQFEGNEPLVMIEGNDHCPRLFQCLPENDIRGEGAANIHPFFLGVSDSRKNFLFFFRSHQPLFSGMRIQPGDQKPMANTAGGGEAVLKPEEETAQSFPLDPFYGFSERKMVGEERNFQLF